MRPVERIPGRGIKENGGVNSTIINCKNFCKCHSVPQHNNNNINYNNFLKREPKTDFCSLSLLSAPCMAFQILIGNR
jgi:hypothetical protein